MKKYYPKVSIIILNWNSLEDTSKCLESLKEIKYANFEIILVDNASDGNEVDILNEKYGDMIEIIQNKENLGFARGCNVGMRYVMERGTDYILLLNNDTLVDPEFLDELVRVAESDPEIGITGPKMYYMDYPDVFWSAGGRINMYLGHWQRGEGKKDKGQFDKKETVDFIAGACMLIKRDIIERIGFLPEDYFLQWDDIDYCTAVRRNGFKCVYVPKAKIWHRVSASFDSEGVNYGQVMRGFEHRIIFRHKYLSCLQFLFFTMCFFLVVIPAHMTYYLIRCRDLRKIWCMLWGTYRGFRRVSEHLEINIKSK